jgi:tRNA pseudouridine38-40 synthase
MARIALGIEYDGSAFCGWQTQPGGCGVQDHLEQALARVHDGPVATIVAGRTDAGVHATGQVVHFDAENDRPETAWVRGVNTWLPPGVAVQWARRVGDGFHARYGARERAYRYVLLNHGVRTAIMAGRVGWVHGTLDVEAMAASAEQLLGVHDFSAFRAAECQARTPVRELRRVAVTRHGHFVILDFRGNAFLHHQVRNMVGALVWVGLGRRPPEWLGDLLASRDRARGAATFAPDGLDLAEVRYDAEWNLPAFDGRVPLVNA